MDLRSLRQKAINNVLALKRENASRVGDPYWTSYTGYNYGRWAERGFNIALDLLEKTIPQAGEEAPDFLRRVTELVRAQRDMYRTNVEDEDGVCSSALDAAAWTIIDALPKEPIPGGSPEPGLTDPLPDAAWEVWYRDTFDREMPPRVEVSGRGLAKGLMELWARFLFETVRQDGGRGFSRFHLIWDDGFVNIDGDWKGTTRLREWVFGEKKHSQKGYVAEADQSLLKLIAANHAYLIQVNQSADRILASAAAAADLQGFVVQLRQLRTHLDGL